MKIDFCGCGSGKRFKRCCEGIMNRPMIGPEERPLTDEEKASIKAEEAKRLAEGKMAFMALSMLGGLGFRGPNDYR